ncbi:type II secretion system F family protein [Blastococcus sp. URHD0036]|uniref:type II secretion system F family protein n=1 Tax=Blastococcus sp. URHD0036 TaxID=1380356 RepID=UPI0004964D9E|nr:type II secretion system F family protein [Blastococcus sp. URHD0036]
MSTAGSLPVLLASGAAALLVWSSPAGRTRARALTRARAPARPDDTGGRPAGRGRRALLPAAAGLATLLLVGGAGGALAAALVAVGVDRGLRRSGDGDSRRIRAATEDELPVACDLLAVCLAAGLPVGSSLAAVAGALHGPLGAELAAVAGRSRLGSGAREAWAGVSPPVAGLGRVVARAGESGSAVVGALRALAADSRAALRTRTEVRVRTAGIWVLAPLGACFLPAFVCLGIAPVVLGIAAEVLP